jgi:hypothetical protein
VVLALCGRRLAVSVCVGVFGWLSRGFLSCTRSVGARAPDVGWGLFMRAFLR